MIVRVGILLAIILVVAVSAFHMGAYRGFMEAGGTDAGWKDLKTKIHGE